MPNAKQSSKTLSKSSFSGSSSSLPTDIKKDVGGICLGSPTITALFALDSEGTASHVGICDASSNMTMSNISGEGCRYCDTVKGLISRQGAHTFKISGISAKSVRRLIPLKLFLV